MQIAKTIAVMLTNVEKVQVKVAGLLNQISKGQQIKGRFVQEPNEKKQSGQAHQMVPSNK